MQYGQTTRTRGDWAPNSRFELSQVKQKGRLGVNMDVNDQISEAPQVPEDSSRYTVEEQLTNSVWDVAGSWIAISVIGIGFRFFVERT
jgi:hypothetical protein